MPLKPSVRGSGEGKEVAPRGEEVCVAVFSGEAGRLVKRMSEKLGVPEQEVVCLAVLHYAKEMGT